MAHCLREDDAREFAELDRNDDGILNLEEISEYRELERKEIPTRFARIDFNGNGEISPLEFGKAKTPRHWQHGNRDEKIDTDFREMDRNRDNALSHREFSRGFFSRSILKDRDRIDAEFSRRDLDEDRELSLEEYSEGRLNYWESRKRQPREPGKAR